jgi:hypothetical protein
LILKATLLILDKTWQGDSAAFSGELIKGYSLLINEFHGIDNRRLADTIGKAFTPGKLISAGRLYSEQNIVSVSEGIAETLRAKYNRNLKDEGGKLKRKG